MGGDTWTMGKVACAALFSAAASAHAAPIAAGDIDSDLVLLSLDTSAHDTPLSNDFECSSRVILGSTAPIGREFSMDPADRLQPREAVSAFVSAITSLPSSSTSSPANKVIATQYDAAGGLVSCEPCGIAIHFLDPLPTKVGLWVTDADAGQSVIFSGPTGFLGSLTIVGGVGAPEFAGWEDPAGISVVILRFRPTAGLDFDDLTASGRDSALCSAPTADADSDGEPDASDVCAATPAGSSIDSAGCSRDPFCTSIDARTPRGALICTQADWKNDEPTHARDCAPDPRHRDRDPRCLAR